MADGSLTLTLTIDESLAETLRAKAAEAGMAVEAYATHLLNQGSFDYEDYEWLNGDPRDPVDPGEADEESDRPWEEVKVELRERLARRLAERA